MEIVIADKSFIRLGVIDNASVIWTSRYYKCGDFELYMPATEDNLDYIKKGSYVIKDDDEDNIGVIEDYEIKNNSDDGDTITVTGRFAPMILGKRVIAQQTQMSGNFQSSVRNLITSNAINPTKTTRKINCIALGNIDNSITETLEMQTTGDNLLTKIEETSESLLLGFRMPLRDRKLYFEMFKGINRSYSQNENPWVVFSDEYDNLKECEYTRKTSEYKNVFLIATEGEGLERKILWGSANDDEDNISDLDRNEIYVDARNMSSNDGEITEQEFYNQMNEEGKTNLTSISEAFSGSVSLQGYIYGKPEKGGDFFLGDVVTIQKKTWNGMYINARVIEVIESEDQNGKVITLTFGI